MNKIYLISKSYTPHAASTNRIMGWAHGFSELGIDAECVFISASGTLDKVNEEYTHVKFTYLWDKYYSSNFLLKYLVWATRIILFFNGLKKGDVVYIYSLPEILKWVVRRRGLRVYVEVTEIPTISLPGSRLYTPNAEKFIESCKQAKGIFVISQNLKNYFVASGLDSKKVHIVNMTVDVKRFENLEHQEVEPYIAYCGSATNNKDGVDQLIKAFAITAKTHPDVRLYIIGSNPKDGQNFSNYYLAKELSVQDKVIFTGLLHPKDIPQILKNARICALDRPNNTQAKYGFPTKLGEYLLTENPVVITDVGNIKDFLVNWESALIAKPDDIHEFADKLSWCLDNPEEAQKIGRHGAEVARREFNNYTETKKIIEILKLS